MSWFHLIILLLLSSIVSCSKQLDSSFNPGPDIEKRESIKEAFQYNYGNYMTYAYPSDCIDLIKLNGSVDRSGGGFGDTPIEALSTMIVMNMTNSKEYELALNIIRNETFYKTSQEYEPGQPGTVKVYEMTIRIMAGMLSAFEMNGRKSEELFLINKTRTLADRIKGAWFLGAKVPVSVWNMNIQSPMNLQSDTNIAEPGSLTIEWEKLSEYTQNQTYVDLAEGSVDAIRGLKTLFPGLPFSRIRPGTLKIKSDYITLGGGFDSYLEYLLKYPIMLGVKDHRFIQTWIIAVESIQKHLIIKTGVNNFTFTADYDAGKNQTIYVSSHLVCFLGGNIAMGGRLLGRDDFTTLGLELTESCAATYDQTALKLGPYGFGYADKNGNFSGWNYVSTMQRKFYNQHGIFVSVGYWSLAHEVLESIFYAWRVTGMQLWRDLAWKIFNNIKKNADTGHGYAIQLDVNDDSTGIEGPQPPSLYGEDLLYLYLIFSEFDYYSLDKVVFNTKGKPFYRKNPSVFNKVQGNFPYTPIYYKEDFSSSASDYGNPPLQSILASTNAGNKPNNIFDAKPGAGKEEYVRQMMSYTEMNKQQASDFLMGMQ